MKTYYNKLVRDNIPDIIEKQGKKANYRYCKDEAFFKTVLSEKLIEEAIELSEAIRDNDIDAITEELIDVRDVVREIVNIYDVSEFKLVDKGIEKDNEKGRFVRRIFLESVED